MDTKQLIDTVKRARRGDSTALQELYLDMYKSVFYLALRVVKNPEDAEDITQEVYITVQQKIAELREPAAFYGWVNQITVNQCNALLRKYKGIARIDDEDEIINLIDDDPANLPDKALDDEATRKIILEVIDNLPDGQRACVILYYYTQNTIAQIADMLETNESTVKSRLALARAKIRAALEYKAEKEGIKLWGIPLAPTPILREAFEQFVMPEGAEARIRDFITRATAENTQNAENPETKQINNTVNTAGKAATKMISKKAIIAAVSVIGAAAVIIAGIVFLPPLFNSPDNTTPPGVTDSGTTQPDTETPIDTDPSVVLPSGEDETPDNSDGMDKPSYIIANTSGNTSGNISNSGFAVIQGDWIYYAYNDFWDDYRSEKSGKSGIYAVKTDGSGMIKLSDDNAKYLNVVGDWIYYSYDDYYIDPNYNRGNLCAMKIDGTEKKNITSYSRNLYVFGDRVNFINSRLYSIDLAKTEYIMSVDQYIVLDGNVSEIAVAGDWIYYTDYNDVNSLYKIKFDGTEKKKLTDDTCKDIQIVGDNIYYLNTNEAGYLYVINTDGTGRRIVIGYDDETGWPAARPYFFNATDDLIYFSNSDDGDKLYSVKPDGSELTKICDDSARELCLVGDMIYYLAREDNGVNYKMYVIKTDGTERRLVN